MATKTLQFAMDRVAELPRHVQEQIAREVLERVDSIEKLRDALSVGLGQLDRGEGQPLDMTAVIARARREHGSR